MRFEFWYLVFWILVLCVLSFGTVCFELWYCVFWILVLCVLSFGTVCVEFWYFLKVTCICHSLKKTTTLHLLRRGYQLIVKWWLSVFILWEGKTIRWLFKGICRFRNVADSSAAVCQYGFSRSLWCDDNFNVCKDIPIFLNDKTFVKKYFEKL